MPSPRIRAFPWVPSVWMPLAQMPLSSAEKADRKALPAPVFDAVTEAYTAPETDTEIALARAFADVLGVERVGVTSSFFDLGGNSLSAMRLAARASDVLGVEVSVRDAFGAPSVREILRSNMVDTDNTHTLIVHESIAMLMMSLSAGRLVASKHGNMEYA